MITSTHGGAGRSASRLLLACLCLAVGARAFAAATVAPLFSDGAVLQRDQPIPVWGRAAPDEDVVVSFRGREARGRASSDGRWHVSLPALPAEAKGSDLVVRASNTMVVRDVVVGDVWLCSGQSNMGRTVAREIQGGVKIALEEMPAIRHFTVAQAVAETPRENVEGGGWRQASAGHTGAFTAVGYLFARELHRDLSIPIGIIHSSWGGTPIEAWTDATILAADSHPAFAGVRGWWAAIEQAYPSAVPAFERTHAKWIADGKNGREPRPPHGGPGDHWRPGVLYNAMIRPLGPYGLKGVLWYQGENNANDRRADQYHAVFSAMIAPWRTLFQQPALPFLWVQLPNYRSDKDWAGLREAQSDTLAVPHTGEAVTIDIGDPNDIHPHNKIEVSRRLALVAKAQVYGQRVPFSGPRFHRAAREGRALRVTFTHADGGLVVRGEGVNDLELAGADRVFHPAQAVIDGATLVVTSAHVPDPVAVRYAWSSNPAANLYNRDALPAAPFRSHRW